ncbi:MAG: hypothetical protein NTW86_10640 [Candidatus Sumerlaeota bacterium]|nr:hypothetical protein [Candidatus Sumerlaeota bacterium]
MRIAGFARFGFVIRALVVTGLCSISGLANAWWGCDYSHWGVSWSTDSQWVRFHTYGLASETEPATTSTLGKRSDTNLLHVATGSWVPDSSQPGVRMGESRETGRLFVANHEGLFTRAANSAVWEMIHPYPVFDMLDCPWKGLVIFHAAGNQVESGTFYASSWSGRVFTYDEITTVTASDVRTLKLPAESPFRNLRFPEDDSTIETTRLWDKDRIRSEPILAEWPEGARLERRGDRIIVVCRDKAELDLFAEGLLWGDDPHVFVEYPLVVAEARISPDLRLAALVIERVHDPRYRLPVGFIVVCDLNDGCLVARVPRRRIGSPYFGE